MDTALLYTVMRDALAGLTESADTGRVAHFVNRVSGAVEMLAGVMPDEQFEELRSAWWRLEYVNAIALADGRAQLDDDERSRLTEAAAEFRALLPEG